MASIIPPPPPTTHNGEPTRALTHTRPAAFLQILPIVFLATFTRGLYSTRQLYNNLVCHSIYPFDEEVPIGCGKSIGDPVGGRTAVILIANFVLQLLVSPYWSHMGDLKGRRFTLAIPVVGNMGAAVLSLIGLFISPGFSVSLVFVVLNLLASTLSGGWVTFYGAVLTYTSEVSSHATLLGRFALLTAVQWIADSVAINIKSLLTTGSGSLIFLLPLISLLVDLFIFAYIQLILKESHFAAALRLPERTRDVKEWASYQPGVWVKDVMTTFKQSRPLSLTVGVFFLVSLARVISGPLFFFSFLKTEDGPAANLISIYSVVSVLGELILLLVVAGVSSLYLNRSHINVAASVKYLALGSISNTGGTHLLAMLALGLHLVIFVFIVSVLSVISFALIPAVLVLASILFEHGVEGHASDRGSFYGGLVLAAAGAKTIGILIYIWPNTSVIGESRSTTSIFVLDAVVVALSAIAAGLLTFVKVPDRDEQVRDEEAEDARQALLGAEVGAHE
ncbi:hypothetical protein DL96DRAFT_1721763 [Flagelloscypha sp. PMI_526]|nr:hypothetical protein DL96DRAFT_1721763 [Flagelloscypha sp. PMI_526]